MRWLPHIARNKNTSRVSGATNQRRSRDWIYLGPGVTAYLAPHLSDLHFSSWLLSRMSSDTFSLRITPFQVTA
jgi:hypothetical protein